VNVTDIPPEDGAHSHQGYDNIVIGGKELAQVPIVTWSYVDENIRSSLALGPNSTVMEGLANASAISGERAEIGLCYGSRSELNSSNGTLVFGGYDAGCVKDAFVEYDLFAVNTSEPCPLQVRMTHVVLTYQNGSKYSITDDEQGTVAACIDPIQNAFTFSRAMYYRWANLTHHPNTAPTDGSPPYTDQTYPLEAVEFMQDLTIELEGGYNVTIPHYELVSHERGSNAQGAYDVINSTRIMAAVSLQNTLQLPVLGGVFLSQTYLRVDYNRQKFQLAHAVTDRKRTKNIVSTCPAPSPPPPKQGLSSGAIAGIVIGPVVAVVAVGVLWVSLQRKKMMN